MKTVTNVATEDHDVRDASAASIMADYQAIKTGAGCRRLESRLLVRVTGDDRVSFLHGMCTAGIKGMTAGQVAPALFVTERAHLIADFFAYVLSDAFLLEIEGTEWPSVRAHLEKFLVADDVEFEELTQFVVIDVEGPQAPAILASTIGAAPELWRIDQARMVASVPRFGLPALTILAQSEAAGGLLESFETAGVRVPINAEALEIMRIEKGIARVGVDTSDKTLALEARLEPAISLRKGCYIGQETLERATARGGIKKRLSGLRIAEGPPIGSGAAITLDEKPVGILSSVAQSPQFGTIGLAILHHSAWDEGARVEIHDRTGIVEAVVTGLPFKNS